MAQPLLNALGFTLLQGVLSSLVCLLFGLLAAPGYAGLGKFKKLFRTFLIFPQIVSPLFTVLGLLIVWKNFPFGLGGIIAGNVVMNAGLCILILGERWEGIDRDWSQLSQFLGAGQSYYFRKVMFPFLLPQLKAALGIVFSFTISSLLIPLVLGGGPQATTLELLIFEKVRANSDVAYAIKVAVIQFVLQLGVFVLLLRSLKMRKPKIRNIYTQYKFGPTTWATALLCLLIFLPYLGLVKTALGSNFAQAFDQEFLISLGNSLVVATVVALAVMASVTLWNFFGSNQRFVFVPSVSNVIIGLGGFLAFGGGILRSQLFNYGILILTHYLGLVFSILRFVGDPLHEISFKYSPVLKVYGCKMGYAIRNVFLPLGKRFYFLAFLITFGWSLGEYSITAMVAPTSKMLPLYVNGLLSQYRLEEAAAVSLVFFVVGLTTSFVGETLFDG